MFTIHTQKGFDCPYCRKAVALLDANNIPNEVEEHEREPLLVVAAEANMTTVPIIYDGEALIGGYTEMLAHLTATVPDLDIPA
jgi:glutaredoxin